jgi:FkbM family methyltransferase
MTLAHRVRVALHRLGVDLRRYPAEEPMLQVVTLQRTLGTTLVLDVGANDGGYARTIRELGYTGRIVSFEPTRDARVRLTRAAGDDERWEVLPIALGTEDGTADINVAGNAAASSSLLPMLDRHVDAAPGSAVTHTETVEVRRLDGLWSELVLPEDTTWLKIDTQGAEHLVLDGLAERLADVAGLQLELSLQPLYEGQVLYRTTLDRLEDEGFRLAGILPGFADRRTGETLQVDGLFLRT